MRLLFGLAEFGLAVFTSFVAGYQLYHNLWWSGFLGAIAVMDYIVGALILYKAEWLDCDDWD